MRECFRLKKMSTLSKSENWDMAMNYVAKHYIQEVDRTTVFEDVKLQMDSKLWAEEYNRHNPPKKVSVVTYSSKLAHVLAGEIASRGKTG